MPDNTPPVENGGLRPGSRLDRYVIKRLIASGGFGITYEVQHATLGSRFAMKEHFPRQFAFRSGTAVQPSATEASTFTWSLDRFIDEGKKLVQFKHPAIVSVSDIFRANGTAYLVMDYIDGISLTAWLEKLGRPPREDEIEKVLMPLLDALEHVHAAEFLHRDIAPDNIMIKADGSPCLIDFGAARQAMGQYSKTLTAIVKAGYSPIEQYDTDGHEGQGAWSDIYALGATLYRVVTGTRPPEAPGRLIKDKLVPATSAAQGRYSFQLLRMIDLSLKVLPHDRPQSIERLRGELNLRLAEPVEPVTVKEVKEPPPVPITRTPESEEADWSLARDLDTAPAYRAFLAKWPAGIHASEANGRLGEISGPHRTEAKPPELPSKLLRSGWVGFAGILAAIAILVPPAAGVLSAYGWLITGTAMSILSLGFLVGRARYRTSMETSLYWLALATTLFVPIWYFFYWMRWSWGAGPNTSEASGVLTGLGLTLLASHILLARDRDLTQGPLWIHGLGKVLVCAFCFWLVLGRLELGPVSLRGSHAAGILIGAAMGGLDAALTRFAYRRRLELNELHARLQAPLVGPDRRLLALILAIWLLAIWFAIRPPTVTSTAVTSPQSAVNVPLLLNRSLTAIEERALKPKDEFQECPICPRMVVIPAGEYLMGAQPSEQVRNKSEEPQHRVKIPRALAVGKFTVTFAEWDACASDGGCRSNPKPSDQSWGRDRRPVFNISRDNIKEYLAWISAKTGKPYRLLTEAEWEYAARAGTTTRFYFGNNEAELPNYAWYLANSGNKSQPIGLKSANAFGLHDMHGNMWQLVDDCWHDNYVGAPSDGSAWTSTGCSFYVIRGGSWFRTASELHSSYRIKHTDTDFTFRVARSLTP